MSELFDNYIWIILILNTVSIILIVIKARYTVWYGRYFPTLLPSYPSSMQVRLHYYLWASGKVYHLVPRHQQANLWGLFYFSSSTLFLPYEINNDHVLTINAVVFQWYIIQVATVIISHIIPLWGCQSSSRAVSLLKKNSCAVYWYVLAFITWQVLYSRVFQYIWKTVLHFFG